jgi:hypothetical protein
MTDGSHINNIRVFRVNDDAAGMMGIPQSHVFPGFTTIFGFVNPGTGITAPAAVVFTGPHPDDQRVRRS